MCIRPIWWCYDVSDPYGGVMMCVSNSHSPMMMLVSIYSHVRVFVSNSQSCYDVCVKLTVML